MSGSTSVPAIVFGPNGPVAPAETAILTGLNADYNAAFGGNLNTAGSTRAGQLIASTAAMLGDCYDQEVLLFQGMDPSYAEGRQQDGIARIYFLERNPAQSTVLQIACGGAVGVQIPVGATIQDQSQNLFLCTQAGTIPSGGSITLSFASAVMSPIAVPATVTIYQVIPQWNTVSVVSGVVGNLAESTAAFEARRQATVAANGAGFLPAISGNIAKVPGVIDWYVTENPLGTSASIGGVTVAANSLYAAVAGGAAADVAKAIWVKKNPGCAYNGSTSFTVSDSNSGYSIPYPTYVVSWTTPTAEAISFTVTIKNSSAVPSTAATQIAAAINAAFLGTDGGLRARIGSEIFASRYYAGVALLGAWAQIISITVGSNASPAASTTGSITGLNLTVASGAGIAVGQFVYGLTVASGTVIVSGSGTAWVVSVNQTVAGGTALTFVAATLNDVTMNINQIPTFAAGNVTLGTMPDVNLVLV